MLQSLAVHKTVKGVYDLLEKDGVIILPSKLGYAILALTNESVDRLYAIKERPKAKPSGVLATPEILHALTTSNLIKEISRFEHPVGFIDSIKLNHPVIKQLSPLNLSNGTLAFFINLDPFMTRLAEYAWKKGQLITISSANKAGKGNTFEIKNLHKDFIKKATLVIKGDDLSLINKRKRIDNITTTIIDLTKRKLVRPGIFVARTKAIAIENYLITDHLKKPSLKTEVITKYFRSCIFLQSFKEQSFRKMEFVRDVDWLALDLEDGCPANMKPLARQLIEKHAHLNTFDHQAIVLRLNELDNKDELDLDLNIRFTEKIKAFALPMLRSAEDVKTYEKKISKLEQKLGLPLNTFKFFPIIETPEAVNHANEIAKASDRNIAMFLGHADLFGALNAERNMLNLHTIRMIYVNAAREGGIAAFDTPYENVKDIPGLEKDASDSMRMGLDGKVALNFEQLEKINSIFGLTSAKKDRYDYLLSKYKGGCQIIDGAFVAPPIVKKIKAELNKRIYHPMKSKVASRRGKILSYGLDYQNAFPGQIISSPYEVTVDESWITSWQSMVQTGNPLETSHVFCKEIGLKGRLIPFQQLVNIGLCLVVESFSESSLYHLGISNVIYERPVFTGDTIRSAMILDEIAGSSNRKYSIFKTRMILINQDGQRVASMNRNSLFPFIDPVDVSTKKEQLHHRDYKLFEEEPYSFLRHKLIRNSKKLNHYSLKNQPKFESGELIFHSITRPMGLSNSLAYSTLYKNTHPLHINNARYGMEGLVVCGGFIIPIIHGSASRDFRFAIDHEIIDTMHINKIHHEDAIGAMSFVVDQQNIDDQIECLTIRTFGLKNIDPQRDLINAEIPDDLLQSDTIKPREIELLCKTYCPQLHHRICARMTWKLWRVRP